MIKYSSKNRIYKMTFFKIHTLKSLTFIVSIVLTQFLSISIASANNAEIDPKINGTATVCKGGSTILEVTIKGENEYASYQWQVSTDNTHFSDIEGATNRNFMTPNLTTTTYFKVKVLGGETGLEESSEPLSVKVVDLPSVQIVSDEETSKNSNDVVLKAQLNGGIDCKIQWQLSDDNGKSWGNMENETEETLSVKLLKGNNNQYRAVAKCSGNGCCD
jgi:hypothetical protein